MTTVLITSASRGIGLATAIHLASTGADVWAGARDAIALADRLHRDSRTRGLTIRPVALDVTDDHSVLAARDTVASGGVGLDVLVNNAGVPGTWAGPDDVGPEDFVGVFETNVFGVVRFTRTFLPLLRRGTTPRLVMVSSGMGSLALQSSDPVYRDIAHLPYPASKAALNMLTVQYAKACPELIVTALDPGLTATEFTNPVGHSIEEGSRAVVAAALDTTGPSGRFIDQHGPTRW